MKRTLYPLVFFLGLIPLLLTASIPGASQAAAAEPSPPPPDGADTPVEAAARAIRGAIDQQREYVLSLLVNSVQVQDLQISEDEDWAIAYLVLVDPESGQPLPTEPGLVIARLVDSEWQVSLPSDSDWVEALTLAPEMLVSPALKETWLEMYAAEQIQAPLAPLDGYLLPWEAGKTAWLSGSVSHDSYIPSCSSHYAFDFYIPQTMFNLYASKGGSVWLARWEVPNGNAADMGNYLIIQDATTFPTTYQLYLHLAQDSIPPELRVRGAPVAQGQFIGVADDTGQSSGHHLHFMVHTNPNSYWGTSVDITFGDVGINGGRPRVKNSYYNDQVWCNQSCSKSDVCEQFQSAYVSGNVIHGDILPPQGDLTSPQTGTQVNNGTLQLKGWATDPPNQKGEASGVASAQFIARYNDAWHDVGPVFGAAQFTYNWDMCAQSVPDGPVSLALEIRDNEGNQALGLPGLTHVVKQFACPPPPSCSPNANQVALFAGPDYTGACVVLGQGEYPDSTGFAAVGNDNVESVKVGTNISATLFTDTNYQGRGETFTANDSSLADNLVESDFISSLVVRAKSQAAVKPSLLTAPSNGAIFPETASIDLAWQAPFGGKEFQVQVVGPFETFYSGWRTVPYWSLNAKQLPQGSYKWKVRARNNPDSTPSVWSGEGNFSITAGVTPTTVTAPFADNVESGINGWQYSGLWRWRSGSDRAHSGTYSWHYGGADGDYSDNTPNTGDLTSPRITLPSSPSGYALNFWYRYSTEGSGRHWDQRWLQISKNGGPFENVFQFADDYANYWLDPTLDLSAYAGSTIQLRFHFATLDNALNQYEGWFIDDVSISLGAPTSCVDYDNSPATSRALVYGDKKTGSLCHGGDIDYFHFEGQAGERVVIDVDSTTNNPPEDIDPILFLLDSDGTSVLSAHDDEIPGQVKDPHLGYLLPRSGTYYLQLRQWQHPASGGADYGYSIRLFKDSARPSATLNSPQSGAFTNGNLILSVEASDPAGGGTPSGISHVEFLWHSGDWFSGAWISLETDQDPSDGWNYAFPTNGEAEQKDVAIFAKVFDWAGNWTGAGAWNLGIDRTAPVSALQPASGPELSTAVQLAWTGSDVLSGIDHFEIQAKKGSASWQTISGNPSGSQTQTYFVGDPGSAYSFRMRAVDKAGNTEPFPTSAETSWSIPNAGVLCSNPDDRENDNSFGTANWVADSAAANTHNFCNPSVSGWLNDEDWRKFNAISGTQYLIAAFPANGATAVQIEVYAANGTTLLVSKSPTTWGQPTMLYWRSDRTEPVYVRMRHVDGRVIGNAIAYQLLVADNLAFLPQLSR